MNQKSSMHKRRQQDAAVWYTIACSWPQIKLLRYIKLQLSTQSLLSLFSIPQPCTHQVSPCAKDISKSWTLATLHSRNHMGLREEQKLATVLDCEKSSEVWRSRFCAVALKCKRQQGQQGGLQGQRGAIMFCESCPAELTQVDRLINNN